jgi:hypothetical protein
MMHVKGRIINSHAQSFVSEKPNVRTSIVYLIIIGHNADFQIPFVRLDQGLCNAVICNGKNANIQ